MIRYNQINTFILSQSHGASITKVNTINSVKDEIAIGRSAAECFLKTIKRTAAAKISQGPRLINQNLNRFSSPAIHPGRICRTPVFDRPLVDKKNTSPAAIAGNATSNSSLGFL